MAYKTIYVPNLKLFGLIKTELWAKKVGELSVMLYGENGMVGALLPTTMPGAI